MSERLNHFLKRNWRTLVNIGTIMAMGFLVYAIRHQLADTLRNLQHVNYYVLLLMIPLQLIGYHAYAKMYKNVLGYLGQPVQYKDMYRVALELNFVNHAFPSGGISGISYFSLRLRQYGVKTGTATLLQIAKYILVFVSFQLLIGLGLLALAIGGKASNLMILVAAVIGTLTVVLTLFVAFIIGSKERINSFFTYLTKGVNKLIQIVRRKHPETINIERLHGALDDMHDNYVTLRGSSAVMKSSFMYALLANLCEVLTIYVVYIAFGEWVNIGAVIIAYSIANFAGLVSVLPGGIGIYEALMTAVLAAAGVAAALSIPVVVMYRILNMALQLLPGWILYQRALQRRKNDAS